MADEKAYFKTGLTGGGAGDLDGIDGVALTDGDFAIVMASDIAHLYILDDDSGTAEDSPRVIAPDANAGNKRWILQPPKLAFPATAVPSADPNTLDDYEEGSWTIGVSFGGGSTGVTYSSSAGYYTRIGNIVSITGRCVLTSKGTDTGAAWITGLPFAVVNNAAAYAALAIAGIDNVSFANIIKCHANPNDTTVSLMETTDAGVQTAIDNTNFADNSTFIIGGTYRCQ